MRTGKQNVILACVVLLSADARLALAVTDAELEALEKQIQQQEAELKRKEQEAALQRRKQDNEAKAEAERKAREEAQRKAEEARQAELEKIREEERQKLLEEERRRAEQARLEEEERLREQEAARIAEEERIRKEVERRLAEEEAERKRQAIEEINKVCDRIVGTWKWNDLAGSVTRFYQDGKVVTTNLLQSSGEWECIDAQNRVFTFNTWNTLRKIYMDENFQEMKTTGLLGEPLTAVRLSDDPEHKLTPGKNVIQELLGQ